MIRDFDIINCNDLEKTYGTFHGRAGAKWEVVLKNELYIMKFPNNIKNMKKVEISYSTAPLSEFLGSHIYEILGFETHKTYLGYYYDKLVVLCKNFDPNRNLLHEFGEIKNHVSSTNTDSFVDSNDTTLSDILKTIDESEILQNKEEIKERFRDMFVIDAFINNSDRNNGNWGLLYDETNPKKQKIAPVYDNGNSFNNKLSVEQIKKRLSDENELINSSYRTLISVFKNNEGKNIKPFYMIKEKENDDLNKAILRNVPKICNKFDEICEFIDLIPNATKTGLPIVSDVYKIFIKSTLSRRLEDVLIPVYEDLKELQEINKCSKGLIKDNDGGMTM